MGGGGWYYVPKVGTISLAGCAFNVCHLCSPRFAVVDAVVQNIRTEVSRRSANVSFVYVISLGMVSGWRMVEQSCPMEA
jgi:hypothetical protein